MRVPDEQLQAILTQTRGEVLAVNMIAMFRAFREAGCELVSFLKRTDAEYD